MLRKGLALTAWMAVFFTYPAFGQNATKILPLGNSITEGTGSTNLNSYRKSLKSLLSDYETDFVGSLSSGDFGDTQHEGRAGWTSTQIRNNVDAWLDAQDPDFVILHIGTNDISQNRASQDIINDIDGTLDLIWNHRFEIRVFLCGIVPRKDGKNNQTEDLNNKIFQLVLDRRNNQSNRIYYVNQFAAITADASWETTRMADDLHPNDTGYDIMAQELAPVISQFLDTQTPVELNTFTAAPDGYDIHLAWQTASETNNLGFAVLHQAPDGHWQEVAFIRGQGTSLVSSDYSFKHRVSLSGVHRYRLNQVDTDGTATLSPEIEVSILPPASLTLHPSYPNPFRAGSSINAFTRIDFELPEERTVSLRVIDILGRTIATLQQSNYAAGRHTLGWNGMTDTGLPAASGTYIMLLSDGQQHATRKLRLIR